MNITVNVLPDLLNFTVSVVTTIVLYFILRHFLFKPIQELLQNRKDYIDGNLREAENNLAESNKIKDEYQKKLLSSKEEARDILKDARKNYESIVSEAKQDALSEKEKILQSAENEAKSMKQKALSSLKDEIIEIAVNAAKDLSGENVNSKKAAEFTEKRLNSLKDSKWQE